MHVKTNAIIVLWCVNKTLYFLQTDLHPPSNSAFSLLDSLQHGHFPQKFCCTLVITGLQMRHQRSLRRIILTTVPPPDDTYGDASECNTSMEGIFISGLLVQYQRHTEPPCLRQYFNFLCHCCCLICDSFCTFTFVILNALKFLKSVDLLMYSAFAAMDQNQKDIVDKFYRIRRNDFISYQK